MRWGFAFVHTQLEIHMAFTPVSTNPIDPSGVAALNLLMSNGLAAGDKPLYIRSALTASVLDLFWETMKAHMDYEDRHQALNAILELNQAMDEILKKCNALTGSLNGAPD
jgi:hypothetical protein